MKTLKDFFGKMKVKNTKGFVLPFTLFICAIMLLISTSISTVLQKQIYFSQLARQSQSAYYAADDALACAISVDSTYSGNEPYGLFPYGDETAPTVSRGTIDQTTEVALMEIRLDETRLSESSLSGVGTLDTIKCAQSTMFNALAGFTVSPVEFSRLTFDNSTPDPLDKILEYGVTSTFNMKMALNDGTFRCAKVTVNKTPTYRRVIAQGYSRCENRTGSVERAVVNTTVTE